MPRRRLAPILLRALPCALAAVESTVDENAPRWIQIAAEGEYRGHPSGAFTLDAEAFDDLVRNFRAHPAYTGSSDVVPYDFHHASEGDASSVAVEGAPAQAWAQELEVRPGANGLELWAKTRLLEPARSYIAQGKYKWTSGCFWPEATDPKTKQPIGWYLSSIAFTNDPFIQGMQPIAASRSWDPYAAPPDTPEKALCAIRELFELGSLASVDDVIAKVAQLRSYALGQGAPPIGVDVDDLVGGLRRIFNLPTLTSAPDVFAEADALLVALAEGSAVSTIGATRKDTAAMDHYKTACLALAARLRVKLPEKPEADDAITRVLCEAVEAETSSGSKAEASLKALMGALKVPDPEAAFAQIADMFRQCAELEAAYPELAELREMKKTSEAKSQEDDVVAAMEWHFRGAPKAAAAARPALVALRACGREAFHKAYPPPSEEERKLLTPLAGAGSINASATRGSSSADDALRLPNGTIATRALLDAAAGTTPNEKAIALVRANGGDKLDHETAAARGFTLRRALMKSGANGAPSAI